jgi:phosphoglycerate dehydrogenase-like enzyme
LPWGSDAETETAASGKTPSIFKLRWICAARAGLGGARFYDALVKNDVTVTNMRGSYNEHLAGHAVAFLLAFARRFDHYLPQKRWQRGPEMIDLPQKNGADRGCWWRWRRSFEAVCRARNACTRH